MTRFAAPISEQIWDMKYRYKTDNGETIGDETVEDTWERIAHALNQGEPAHIERSTKQRHRRDLYQALEDFKLLPAGRITAGAGTGRMVTLFNCFVMGTVPDSMAGIFDMLKEAALTMQQGGGIGYDFSTIRPKNAPVKKLDADASGPLTFMDVWDAMCRTVMSAGSRRGAMMATMRCDHPDIEEYITAKHDSARLRMFNMSVLITDPFMEAVKNDEKWDLVFDGKVYKTVFAVELWNSIMRSTYDAAEPGVIFIDRINADNNLRYCETIASTNPCGEQPLPPYGACLLGSINLARLVKNPFTGSAKINKEELEQLVAVAVRNMDNVIEVSNFPLPKQKEEAFNKRRIGLGVTGLADALIMCGLTYGTEKAIETTEMWMKRIAEAAYRTSVGLAKEKGAFPLFDADEFLAEGTAASRLASDIKDDIREHGIRNALLTSIAPTGTISLYAGNVSSGIEPVFAYRYTRKVLQKDGSRTEEEVCDYAYSMYKSLWENGSLPDREGFQPARLEWSDEEELPDYFVNAQTLPPMAHVHMQAAAQKWVDSSISKTVNCPEDISFEDFKDVYMAAWDMGCKGCTTYRPNDITGSVLSVEEKPKESLESDAAPKGCITLYDTDGNVLAVGVSHSVEMSLDPDTGVAAHDVVLDVLPEVSPAFHTTHDPSQAEAEERFVGLPEAMRAAYGVPQQVVEDALPERPKELNGTTYKIEVGDQKTVYLTVNDKVEPNGTSRPFEVFLRSGDPTSDEWMQALSRMISAILRRPHDASFVPRQLRRIHSAHTGGFLRGGGGKQPSLVAAIGAKLEEHMNREQKTGQTKGTPIEFRIDSREVDIEAVKAALSDTPHMHPNAQIGAYAASNPVPKGTQCPECFSGNMKKESGCPTCLDCGYSSCG